MFLRVDFPFTITDLETFKLSTVNLDHSIRKELSQIRGVSRLKDCGLMRTIAPLPFKTRIKMSMEDVCEEVGQFCNFILTFTLQILKISIINIPAHHKCVSSDEIGKAVKPTYVLYGRMLHD